MLLRPFRPYVMPRALETEEVEAIVEDFRRALQGIHLILHV